MPRTLKEARQAFGRAVDDLQKMVGDAAAFDTQERAIADLEVEIATLERTERATALVTRSHQVAKIAPVMPEAQDLADVRFAHGFTQGALTMNGLCRQARSLGIREGRSIDFDDCLYIARRGIGFAYESETHFANLGQQLQAIFQHYATKGSNTDSRLVRAPTGAGEVDPTGGGFLVQVDFASSVFMLAHDMGEILSRVNKIPISANSNGIKIPGVDESSRATGSRWGGVSSKWGPEGTAGDESKPKFRLVEFDLKKLISKMTISDEMLQDSDALTAIAGQAFSEEVMFMVEDAIVEGDGQGKPLGFLNSPAFIQVAIEKGQAAGTIQLENINKMWSRMWARSRKNAVWFINQDCEPQLFALNQPVGTGGQTVFLPPGGAQNAPNASLLGRSLIATEYNSALGAVGDIALADLSQYSLVDKNSVQMASSMHVAFDTDEMRFRITYRVDGKPMWHQAIQPFKGTNNTRSPFVGIAAR